MSLLKVIIHAPTEPALQRAQANLRNLLLARPDAQIELVVNGPAVASAIAISNPAIRSRLRLCENSLRVQNITPPSDIQQVNAAILHLSERQQQGWSYIRA
ncbi:hypothetical protein [Oceanisphaera sp.]|uniref:DsrE family protein n=1 Tax=Oceanisphaera sp. TaxID=1929979 RepID=UPI003A94C9CA